MLVWQIVIVWLVFSFGMMLGVGVLVKFNFGYGVYVMFYDNMLLVFGKVDVMDGSFDLQMMVLLVVIVGSVWSI